jgi:hypothetical protein
MVRRLTRIPTLIFAEIFLPRKSAFRSAFIGAIPKTLAIALQQGYTSPLSAKAI